MTIAVEQTIAERYNSGGGDSASFPSDTVTGNTIVVGCGSYDGGGATGLSVSDNKGNSYIERAIVINGQGSSHIWVCENANGGPGHQITITPDSGSPDVQWSAVELSGGATWQDSNSGSGTSGGTATPGALTSDDGDFLYARLEEEEEQPSGATWSGSTSLGIADYSQSLYKLVSSGGSEEPSWSLTSGDDWEATIARFSAAAGESPSISPSASQSPSVSPSSSVSPSASLSPSIALLSGVTWGEETPDADEEAQEWPRFQTAPGTPINVTGDADWGKAGVADGTPGLGNVIDLGSATTRTFTVIANKYGTGDTPTIYIRGSATLFAQHDGSPSWNLYSSPTEQSWRYVQIRMDF